MDMGVPRPGSGRKKSTKATLFHLDLYLIDKVKDIKNKSRFFNAAIREKLERMETFTKEGDKVE